MITPTSFLFEATFSVKTLIGDIQDSIDYYTDEEDPDKIPIKLKASTIWRKLTKKAKQEIANTLCDYILHDHFEENDPEDSYADYVDDIMAIIIKDLELHKQ